jgi:glyoxylate reductase
VKRVFISRRLPKIAHELLEKNFKVESFEENQTIGQIRLKEIVRDFDAILSTLSDKMDREILSQAKNLKVISNCAMGLDNIDLEYAREKGIKVYNLPKVTTASTADMAFSLLLSFARQIPQKYVQNSQWQGWDPEIFNGEELEGKTLGVLGFGAIGQAVAKRAHGFGLKVIYYNRSVLHNVGELGTAVNLDALYEQSDYISVHLALNAETKYFLNRSAFIKMKRQPLILNLARGDVIEQNDLLEALDQGHVRGAALDVTSPEPIKGDHPLCQHKKIMVVPHIGSATVECRIEMARWAAQNIVNHFEGQE